MRVGICATLNDGFFEEARSRLIWASSTTDAYKSLGFEAKLIANASNTNIPYTNSPQWVVNELKSFYGVSDIELLPVFNPNKYYSKDNESFIYDFLFPKVVLPYIDLIHSRDPRTVFSAIQHQKRVILEDHDEDVQKAYRERVCELMNHDNFKMVACITQKVKDVYIEMGAPKDKLEVVDSGVNFLGFESKTASVVKRNSRLAFGYAGGLQPERDIDNLIKVAEKNLDKDFVFIGGRESLVKQLKITAQDAGAFNIEFLGYLKFTDMRKVLLNRCDGMLYTRASGKHEENSSPLKLFDYFNYEKPIVCANTRATEQYLTKQGIFEYKPSNMTSLDQAIKSCANFIKDGAPIDPELISLAESKSWKNRQQFILSKIGII